MAEIQWARDGAMHTSSDGSMLIKGVNLVSCEVQRSHDISCS